MHPTEKKTIAILFGGPSPEYPVSLQSAHAVITHLDTQKYLPVLVGITQAGQWFRYRGPAENILNDSWQAPQYCTPALISPCRQKAGLVEYGIGVSVFTRLHAAFPVMHGAFGEDGAMQGLLQLAGIPIVGCGALASAACMDKDVAHRLVAGAGIAVPASATASAAAPPEKALAAAEKLGWPVFVKPVRAGSSFGITRVENAAALPAALAEALRYDSEALIEEAIDGFEVGCAVLGGAPAPNGADALVGELDEVELSGGVFDYTEKYTLKTACIHVPARLPAAKADEVKRLALTVYRLLRCTGFARVDFFVTPAGRVVFNEVNTIPGFTPHSRYPSMMRAAGLSFGQMVDRLIETAVAV